MKLPLLNSSKLKTSKLLIKDKYKIVPENKESKDNKLDSFVSKLNEVQEIKIYLSKNFNAYDVDEVFIKDMETEYAEQFLNKLEMLPTKALIHKILTLRPLEKCDFYLTNESMINHGVEKLMKIVHIYPGASANSKKKLNQSEDAKKNNIKKYLGNNIQSSIKLKLRDENKELKEKIAIIKKNNKNELDNLIYNKEKIDEIFTKDFDDLQELKLFSQKNSVNVNLSFENIKKKYIIIKKIEDYETSEKIINCKGKFYNISNSISGQKNILNDPKYTFDITDIKNFSEELIKEVTEPLDVQLEVVMKDINYILDNFPIEKFINTDNDRNNIINKDSPKRCNSQGNNKIYRINLDNQEDIIKILKIFHSMDFYRLVCLTLSLIYWIVLGNQNNVQIDKNTKEYLYLKLLKQIDIINAKVSNIKLLSKVFVPLEIILIRIEVDNYISRKYVLLFDDSFPENKERIMILINNIITEIFDKHGYMNSFETICGSREEFNKKFTKNLLPRFKKKIFATSNVVEQLFNNDKSDISKISMEEIKQRQDFLMGPKADFFNAYLQKINNKLKKRNLAPIFTLSNNKKIVNSKKIDEIIDRKHKKDYILSLENDNNIPDNERYTNVDAYIDNSIKKFKDIILNPINTSKTTVAKTESNYTSQINK